MKRIRVKPGIRVIEGDVKLVRLQFRFPFLSDRVLYQFVRSYIGLYRAIVRAHPDVIFIHGCQFLGAGALARYKKLRPDVRIYVDNHADRVCCARNWLSLHILHRVIWKRSAKTLEKVANRFWGVLPVRVAFLTEVYGISPDKAALLRMGAEDDKLEQAAARRAREEIRRKYGARDGDILIMTGGKVSPNKPEFLSLLRAMRDLKLEHAKLVFFGAVCDEMKQSFSDLCDGDTVFNAGWLSTDQTYDYLLAADLAVFPGTHSVLWEQAVGQGVPLILRRWPGVEHIDIGGNVMFLETGEYGEILKALREVLSRPEQLRAMREAAEGPKHTLFLYSDIARRAIGLDEAT